MIGIILPKKTKMKLKENTHRLGASVHDIYLKTSKTLKSLYLVVYNFLLRYGIIIQGMDDELNEEQ